LLCIPSVEESGALTGEQKWLGHILNIGATAQSTALTYQSLINAIVDDGAVAGFAHPNYSGSEWRTDTLKQAQRASLIEIRNSITSEDGEAKWRSLLDAGIPIWAITVDDCHNDAGANFDDWLVIVNADSCSAANVKLALRDGNFYCSEGPAATCPTLSVSVSGNVITATAGAASTIAFYGDRGALLQTTASETTEDYTAVGDERYIYVKTTRDSDSKLAWSQPVFVVQLGSIDTRPTNNGLCVAYVGTEQVDMIGGGDPHRLELDTVVIDQGSNFVTGDAYGASGAYRQSDADSDSTHIQDDDAAFVKSKMLGALVKWASTSNGVTNAGTGYVSNADTDTLTIAKNTGADFAANYYYWIKYAHYVVPVSGIYDVTAVAAFSGAVIEAGKDYLVVLYQNGVGLYNSQWTTHSAALNLRAQFASRFAFTAGDILIIGAATTGTTLTHHLLSGTGNCRFDIKLEYEY